ncbi:ABC transporter permease [Mesorhizobium sp. M1C.F.Ca.ET.193.01.1.1]|uniref:ABC transporter permease n=1 Tax=unclassified Mesorhizobium TaxID=325217 RepID=UPI000FD61A8F|nr:MULTISPECIES: ABC transporter permease [unclassified Mesorhizobium]TGT01401.1 ABC transporter permease [bacterium M00.F.Ca.ET.177.01.1.1]TGQ54161.1 ABC transporter permease [Mesorhizobium sp. M1C.F.Ca.ET.210.01.1.1]TGQ72174.1 ABC transporter permease [Mesorhizobium sp. M1C.F.Ca.ET.212.01.1.1]TGR09990.1 ABC transporter permease [Mesorhizobium sp. M1C.F.Ca.ET.204.01.1.1]TGR30110.1 ABC transporter permease [Mesorhizobium sp. M1C.F.Ca.ET.196.01.1.1]
MRLILDIAITHIAGRGRQTLVAVLGVAVGVGFSIAMAALMQGGQDDFVRQLVDTMPHVDITDDQRTARRQPAEDAFGAVAISGLRPRDDRRGIINPTAATAWLASWIPGRFAVSLKTQGVIRYSSREVGAAIIGIDPGHEPGVSPIVEDFVQGSFNALAAGGNNVLVGDTMAKRLGTGFGDTITVVSSEGLTRSFKIVGLFHTGTTARDEGEAYVLLKNAQILSQRPNAINEIRIKLNDPNRAPAVAHRTEAELGYKSVAWQEANESILQALIIRNIIMYTVVGAIMLVAGFGIYNIISTITHEKARDIAIMKSLGFLEADMRRMFLLEGVAIGSAGSVLGWLLGFSMVYGLSLVRFEIAATGQEMTHLPIAWSVLHYVIASAFAIGSAAVAGYLPARRAARQNPVDIIRGAT